MKQAAYVAVDWGTSSFRLWLVDRAGDILGERRSHEGMMVAGKPGFATVLQSHLEAVGAAPGLPVVVCGMAGARRRMGRSRICRYAGAPRIDPEACRHGAGTGP